MFDYTNKSLKDLQFGAIMKTLFAFSFIALLSLTNAFAQDGDLVLAAEKWQAKFTDYKCVEAGPSVSAPSAFAKINLVMEKMTTDSTLDNGLIKASFKNNGVECRYSAIVLADNDLKTIKLVNSKAFAPAKNGSCDEGKAVIDAALADNVYLYYGHPHNLAIMVPVVGADSVCQGATHVALNFVVAGRIK